MVNLALTLLWKHLLVLGESHCDIRKTGRTQPLVKKRLLRTFIILLTYNIRQYTFVNQHHREERPKTIWNISFHLEFTEKKKTFRIATPCHAISVVLMLKSLNIAQGETNPCVMRKSYSRQFKKQK